MLNDAKVRAAKAQSKPYKLTDAHRLHLLVTPKGAKLWRWGYSYDSKEKTLCIGPYPLIGLAEARDRRDEARKLLADPTDQRLPADARSCLDMLAAQLRIVKEQILENDRQIRRAHERPSLGRRPMETPGVGPRLASAIAAPYLTRPSSAPAAICPVDR